MKKLTIAMGQGSTFELCMRLDETKVGFLTNLKMELSDLRKAQDAVNTINEFINPTETKES
tara:strand:- start:6768 stop:6950 length:183 start_codon:yes stop_codon:yes gene_type:complete